MIQISCFPSPFVFKPVYQLIRELNWQPKDLEDKLLLYFLNPMNKEFKKYTQDSHRTDAQSKEEQLRFLGNSEIDKKLMSLARKIQNAIGNREVRFVFDLNYKPSEHFLQFINYLELFSDSDSSISVNYKKGLRPETSETSDFINIENLYFSSDSVRTQHARQLFEGSKNCSNATDYQSAINLLLSIRDLDLEEELYYEIITHLAICHRASGEFMQSAFYNDTAAEKGNLTQRTRAHYSLGMLNIRHYPPKFRDIEKGAKYLQDIYAELLTTDYSNEEKEVDLVFNRNGYVN